MDEITYGPHEARRWLMQTIHPRDPLLRDKELYVMDKLADFARDENLEIHATCPYIAFHSKKYWIRR